LVEKYHAFYHDNISFLFFLKIQKPVSRLCKLKKDEKRDFCFKSNPFFNLIRDQLLKLVNQEKDEEKHGIVRSAFFCWLEPRLYPKMFSQNQFRVKPMIQLNASLFPPSFF
jgi:hypothetical protein